MVLSMVKYARPMSGNKPIKQVHCISSNKNGQGTRRMQWLKGNLWYKISGKAPSSGHREGETGKNRISIGQRNVAKCALKGELFFFPRELAVPSVKSAVTRGSTVMLHVVYTTSEMALEFCWNIEERC